jgi:hypothetical protein
MMNLTEIPYKVATSTFLSVVDGFLKSSHAQNMLLHIESNGIYSNTHHKQVKVVHCILLHRKGKLTIAKLKSSRLSYNVVVSLPY